MSKRRRKPQRGRRESIPWAARGGIGAPERAVHRRDAPFVGDAWEALRQGARNVAGVRYQLLVTAYLLAESRRGTLPFVELVPEGLEDIDCFDRDSRQWFVQVKEVGAGFGRFTASSVAEVISRAARVAESPHRIVVVTDGQLGSQLVESGWDLSIFETSGPGLDKILVALLKRGHKPDEAQRLARSLSDWSRFAVKCGQHTSPLARFTRNFREYRVLVSPIGCDFPAYGLLAA